MNGEPQKAIEYDDRTTSAVKSVLLEIGQILGSYRGKFAVIGGSVPWLLLEADAEMKHVGTVDIDLSLNAEKLADEQEYAELVEALQHQGYESRDGLRNFQMVRTIDPKDGRPPIEVIVDFLRPYDAVIEKNKPAVVPNFATQRASGADLAHEFFESITIEGEMPEGGQNKVVIPVASIPALLAMKGFALDGRLKQKDAYDVHYSIRNFPGGIDALVAECQPLLHHDSGVTGFKLIVEKFRSPDDFGPTCIWRFVDGSTVSDGRSQDEWQQDAFGQVDAWAKGLGLR